MVQCLWEVLLSFGCSVFISGSHIPQLAHTPLQILFNMLSATNWAQFVTGTVPSVGDMLVRKQTYPLVEYKLQEGRDHNIWNYHCFVPATIPFSLWQIAVYSLGLRKTEIIACSWVLGLQMESLKPWRVLAMDTVLHYFFLLPSNSPSFPSFLSFLFLFFLLLPLKLFLKTETDL